MVVGAEFPAAAVVEVFAATAAVGGGALAGLEEDAAVLGAVGRRRRERAVHRCESPLLDVGFDEDEAELAEVDVHGARAVRAERREQVEGFEPVRYVVEFFAVAGEEDGTAARSVPNAYYVALDVGGAIGCARERLVVAAVAGRGVREGVLMPSCRRQKSVGDRSPIVPTPFEAGSPGNRNIG